MTDEPRASRKYEHVQWQKGSLKMDLSHQETQTVVDALLVATEYRPWMREDLIALATRFADAIIEQGLAEKFDPEVTDE